jgi:hypothetical protein
MKSAADMGEMKEANEARSRSVQMTSLSLHATCLVGDLRRGKWLSVLSGSFFDVDLDEPRERATALTCRYGSCVSLRAVDRGIASALAMNWTSDPKAGREPFQRLQLRGVK